MNAQITADTASISPFSHVRFRNLKVVTTGSEPLMTAQEVNARYSLMKIIGGNMVIHDVEIASPTINIVSRPSGFSGSGSLGKTTRARSCTPGLVALTHSPADSSSDTGAGVPQAVRFRTRPQLALQLLDERGPLLPHAWVSGDD